VPGVIRLDLQVDDGVTGERLAHALGLERPAAERDHLGVAALQQLADHLGLARAELLFAVTVEERLDRLAEPLLELTVGVEGLGAQLGGQRPGAGRLPRAHEADQDDRAACGYARRHPMRSS
jgi:hypothetical protein